MSKLVDFQVNYQTETAVISNQEEFEVLKKNNPGSHFAALSIYPNYRKPSAKKKDFVYIFTLTNCKTAICIESESAKAYRLQIEHISGHFKGVPLDRHFKWVSKSLVNIVDNIIYYPAWA